MSHLNFTYLKYFLDAASHENLSMAARENFVSQPAISQGIAKLEAALNVKLTTHQKNAFKLTEEGEIVFKEARRLFSSLNDIKNRLNELKGEIRGEIKFACTNAISQYFLPNYYLKMRKLYPHVGLKFHRGSLSFIHEAIRSQKVSFAIALDSPEFDAYDSLTIRKGFFRLYCKKGKKFDREILVDHENNSEVIELKKRYFERYQKPLKIKDALSGWALVLRFIELGYGAGYLPDFMSHNLKAIKLDIRPIQYSICIIRLRGSPLSRAEKAFIDLFKS